MWAGLTKIKLQCAVIHAALHNLPHQMNTIYEKQISKVTAFMKHVYFDSSRFPSIHYWFQKAI